MRHDRTLLECALVNSLWNSESIRRIWQKCCGYPMSSPSLSHLSVLDQDKRELYAKHVKSLDLNRNYSYAPTHLDS